MGDTERTQTATSADHEAEPSPTEASAEPTAEIRPGDCLGRYTVNEIIGSGGIGQVFSAFDPELGRTVAVKVLRTDHRRNPSRAQARLRREAQALARLHHPNVVTVHDVGFQGDRLFIAMELVEGMTLRHWLRGRRSRREIIQAFVAAGRGLAAAHGVGIIHRDFKPENVIVGADRVVVVDFGLARAGADDPPDDGAAPARDTIDLDLTATGELVGTPRYMAPEQRGGGPVTPKADQYAFCVALREGLQGEAAGARKADVPAWLDAAVKRGLETDPEARWPSMVALLAALGRDPAVRRRRIGAGAAGVAVAVAASWAIWRSGAKTSDPCLGGAARLGSAWDAARSDAVGAAFAAAHIGYADDAWRRVRARVDDYTGRWVDMYTETCRATRVEGRQSDTLMDLRMACLEGRRTALDALTSLWSRGMSAESVEHASEAAGALEPLAPCGDAKALTDRAAAPENPVQAALVAAARPRLDALTALNLAHRWADARKLAPAVRAQADATGWPQLRAEAAWTMGDVLSNVADPAGDEPLLEAARLAGAAHDDRLAARALVRLVGALAADHQNAERALLAADVAEVSVARTGDDGLRAELLRRRGHALLIAGKLEAAATTLVAARALATAVFGAESEQTIAAEGQLVQIVVAQGDYAAARKLGEETLDAIIALHGPEHPQTVFTLNNLAANAAEAGDREAAVRYLRRAVAINEHVSGPDSPVTAISLNNLGLVERELGHLDEAQALLERALSIRERALGPEHSFVGSSLANLAAVRRKQGHREEALALLQRALAIKTRAHGPEHAQVAFGDDEIGDVYRSAGDFAAALVPYQRSLDIRKKALGNGHPLTLYSMTLVGGALARMHRCPEARPLLDGAAAGLEKAVGRRHPDFISTLVSRAVCDLAEGRAATAVEELERALAADAQIAALPVDRGAADWLLTEALWAQGRRAEAVAAAQRAEAELAADADGARDRAAAQAWLAKRR